ncbi:MAG: ABC transporter ATP-binding protein [Tagaea sp.]|nr:ABC transporter ATP-binding protein [Tagaea sp.]
MKASGADLAISGLVVEYATSRGALTALDGVDLSIGRGEFVAVLGPSGCGKSTLLRIVAGLIKPKSGAVALGGRPVEGPRGDVGIVFQQATLLPWKTVLENVMVPIRTLGRPLAEGRERAKALLDMVGLAKFAEHYPHELSGGMQQRVGIARGLVHDPDLLLMDEPFGALDAMTRERMAFELQDLWAKADKSVLFITHSIPEAVFLADRVVVLGPRPGKVIDVLDAKLPRPRTVETMATPEFAAACTRLRGLFGSLGGLD